MQASVYYIKTIFFLILIVLFLRSSVFLRHSRFSSIIFFPTAFTSRFATLFKILSPLGESLALLKPLVLFFFSCFLPVLLFQRKFSYSLASKPGKKNVSQWCTIVIVKMCNTCVYSSHNLTTKFNLRDQKNSGTILWLYPHCSHKLSLQWKSNGVW